MGYYSEYLDRNLDAMDEKPRFKLVFAKLRAALEAETCDDRANVKIRPLHEVTPEELDELERLRRIVIEVTAPERVSFTTT